MGNNVPKDYLGYSPKSNHTWQQQLDLSNTTVLENAPCYDPATDSHATAQACYNTIMRLSYLNQQSDLGSITLRAAKKCLTQKQLNAIPNFEVADNHPLNCAKMNAKPYPYFDGGLMIMKKSGWFPYYSSRNNNFSNRQNIGVICVGSNCKVDNSTGVLQDRNPQTNGITQEVNTAPSTCVDSAGGAAGATANGAHSCLPATSSAAAAAIANNETVNILSTESFARQVSDFLFRWFCLSHAVLFFLFFCFVFRNKIMMLLVLVIHKDVPF
jgi:hypothetical protein